VSAYSTVYISREKALSLIHAGIATLSDTQLEEMVNVFLEPRLQRASIGYNEEHDSEVHL